VAFRLICWFPPKAGTVVIALFAAEKQNSATCSMTALPNAPIR
jgi:hypothetical protein